MINIKEKLKKIKPSHLQLIGFLMLILLAVLLLWFGNSTSMQAESALVAEVYFAGEYKIGDGDWHPIVEGEHIPATAGDVTLRGNFHLLTPYGDYIGIYRGDIPIAFYTDHINLTIYETGLEPGYIDNENPIFGDASCAVLWMAYLLESAPEEDVEILVHNPHVYGNEMAIDEMLSSIALWTGIEFEKEELNKGEPQRNVGMLLVLVAIVLLGIALFSGLIHIKNNKIISLLGALVLFAGLYVTFSTEGVSFWSESVVTNTTVLGFSMMLYMMFLSVIIVYNFKNTRKIGNFVILALGLADAAFFVIPVVSNVLFYDTWVWWVILQSGANLVILGCLIAEIFGTEKKERWLYIGAVLPLLAFAVDAFSTWIGMWKGGVVSGYVFIAMLAVVVVMVLKFIPESINATAKAKELEMERIVLNAELAESRISTMMSQIRPHFIYNTLGSIEQLCKLDPPKAADLVHNFAKYLRGNFGELDNPKPILMSQEMEHVRHYLSIENVRFPDMTFTFEMNSVDFNIPALTIQPIVENAIKHGLMKLPRGGTISVVSFETETDYCICVEDNGVGFDTSTLSTERKHVGIRNIRERLKVMVNGTLLIESTPGVGTKVSITIPKQGPKTKGGIHL